MQELDLDDTGRLVPVTRPYGENTAGLICGLVTTPTPLHPQGVSRVLLCGDPLRALGAVAEPECARVIAALDLAEERGLPVEWFALSAGARISMDSGTENMDWVAKALKRIIEFTQAGHEINVVVAGINVGAQPYWNAEATMLMHTKGILVMTPDSAMVLTGKQSLDFSGGVSAEDNFGIGGYDRVMGPNGQAQYWAKDLVDAYGILLAHYENTWVAPGEPGPRRAPTSDPHDRDVTPYPHALAGSDFTSVGDIFSPATNADRKKAFDIRTLMRAVADQDHGILERWAGMADAETAVVFDARVGGIPVCLLGIESKTVPRRGVPPTDGPDVYTAGTLFPRSSKKAARAINAASGNRPLVVLANLSGFDGSPDSMRALQLEYGAEIGRAVVNFDGPIVFVVVSRYHGGAFVVFSKALNPRMTVLAVEGSFASVIGGAPAAAVVFARDVDARTAGDPRVAELQTRVGEATGAERAALATELDSVRTAVRAEMLGQVASEFDRVHDIHRAVEVGSVDAVIAPHELRPRIIAAIEATATVVIASRSRDTLTTRVRRSARRGTSTVTRPVAGSAHDLEVELRGAQRAHQAQPHRQDHLRPAGGLDAAEVDDVVVAERGQQVGHGRLGRGVLTGDEHRAARPESLRVHHQVGVEGVQGLDDLGLGERPLHLLAERVGVLDEQAGREPLREVERVRDVHQRLPGQVLGAGQGEHLEGGGTRARVDHELRTGGGVGVGRERHVRVVGVPRGERRGAHGVGLGAGQRVLRVPGPDDDGVAELVEPAGDRAADGAGAEDCDVHGFSCGSGGGQ